MTVIPFRQKDDDSVVLHLSGEAKCLACGHIWDALVKVGVAVIDCPACGTHKGVFRAFCLPDAGNIWVCGCGSHLFYFTSSGGYCAACAAQQVFP